MTASDAAGRARTQSTPSDVETMPLPGGLVAILLTAEQARLSTPASRPGDHSHESPEHARRRRRVAGAERSRRLYGTTS